ncbi:SNX3 protein, partial [Polypterus senegalus]|nr:SNX3 protein [Polypterus senegalus]
MAEAVADTRRLLSKPQNLSDAYGPPSNFLEIDVANPQTVGVGRGRFTTYEIRLKTHVDPFSVARVQYRTYKCIKDLLMLNLMWLKATCPSKNLDADRCWVV